MNTTTNTTMAGSSSSSLSVVRKPLHVIQRRSMAGHAAPQYVSSPAEIPPHVYLGVAIVAIPLGISAMVVPKENRYIARPAGDDHHGAHAGGAAHGSHPADHHAPAAASHKEDHGHKAVVNSKATEHAENRPVVVVEVVREVINAKQAPKHVQTHEDEETFVVVAEAEERDENTSDEGL